MHCHTSLLFLRNSCQVVIMHNKISLPGIAWSRKKNREKGALCFQEKQKAIITIEIVRPYFLTTDLGPLPL